MEMSVNAQDKDKGLKRWSVLLINTPLGLLLRRKLSLKAYTALPYQMEMTVYKFNLLVGGEYKKVGVLERLFFAEKLGLQVPELDRQVSVTNAAGESRRFSFLKVKSELGRVFFDEVALENYYRLPRTLGASATRTHRILADPTLATPTEQEILKSILPEEYRDLV